MRTGRQRDRQTYKWKNSYFLAAKAPKRVEINFKAKEKEREKYSRMINSGNKNKKQRKSR
jgi:hypothetical protein